MLREILGRTLGAVLMCIGVALCVLFVLSAMQTGNWWRLGGCLPGLLVLGMGWSRLFPTMFVPLRVDFDNPQMRAAIARARQELARLHHAIAENRKQVFVKFPLSGASGKVEHIWGLCHQIDDRVATVTLANTPVDAAAGMDPRIQVALNDIEDWMLVDGNGAIEGGYTTQAMARIYKQQHGYVPYAMRQQLLPFKDLLPVS